jgi:alkyldihydroxyacetonephosphate synthase
MHEMSAVKWIDRKSMLACVQAGAVGKQLEAELNAVGLCTGHEPDSSEFSTLGGWIATRASGMRKNKYVCVCVCVCECD